MVFKPKCVLVTGATSGIGQSLAQAIYRQYPGTKIIATGRRQDRLDQISAGKDRIYGRRLDQNAGQNDLKSWVKELLTDHPDLDTVILNAGVQNATNFTKPESLDLNTVRTMSMRSFKLLISLQLAA